MLKFLQPENQKSKKKQEKPRQSHFHLPQEKKDDDSEHSLLTDQFTMRRKIRLEDEAQKHSKAKLTEKAPPRKGPPPHSGRSRPTKGGEDDEFERLAKMLELINKRLDNIISMKKQPVPQELRAPITNSWPAARKNLETAATKLRNRGNQAKLRPELKAAGLTGEMLGMKETSLSYHMARVEKAILTYDQNESMLEKFVRWIKPGFSVMNSILGSLPASLGLEAAKEFKEHLEAAYEVVETGQPE